MEASRIFPERTVEKYQVKHADLTKRGQNMFIVSERDHNYYDDSDTNFLYYDADQDCLTYGQWTTRGYCGNNFYDYPKLTYADDTTREKAERVLRMYLKSEATPESFTDYWWWQFRDIEEYGIPCVVDGGRKFRGEGILLKYYEQESYYGTSRSVSIWTGTKTEFANAQFVKVDSQLILDTIYNLFDEMDFFQLYQFAEEHYDNKYDTVLNCALRKVCPIVESGKPTLEMKRESLRDWVSDKFRTKSEEEQERITHCIMMKKYGMDV